jgi:hypothetical protein
MKALAAADIQIAAACGRCNGRANAKICLSGTHNVWIHDVIAFAIVVDGADVERLVNVTD